MTNTLPQRPEQRYGRSRISSTSRRAVAIAMGVLAVALGLVVATIGYQRFAAGDIRGEMLGYELIGTSTVQVTISVTRADPSQPAVCILRARSVDGSETGRRELLVAPSDEATVQVTGLVRTSRPAATGDIYGCGLDVPSYLVAPQ